ncbi:serine/threonine protein kinase [Serratia marcescens]|nr:serine/threonine protein kinase [Serratia marcescens]OCN20795.1 serine/threonine protein kinase [Serratia marcescens]OCN41860.1 serine/threonine protein kinase [Serratia marcescens]OCN44170.1 serine/threonine protein kinase [Serratia marcescens]OCN63920.1 serine/threonine protein kinase [Serratia marcescens]
MTGHKNTSSCADNAETGIAHLPLHLTAILCQLALHDDLAKSSLLDNLHQLEISPVAHRRMNPADMADALKILLAQGWLQEMNNRYHLAGHDNVVYRYMVTHPAVWGACPQHPGHSRLLSGLRTRRARMWHALLAGDEVALPQHLDEWMTHPGYAPQAHPAFQLLADEAGRHTFALLNEAIQIALLTSFLVDACYRLTECSAIYQYACTFSDARSTTQPALREPLALQALWRGDHNRLDQIRGEGELPPTVTGWIALSRGQKDAALDAYRRLVSQYRKATRKRKLHLPPLPSMMAALTLLANHEPAYTATLRELAHHAIEEGFGSGWVLLQGLLHECEGKPPQGTSPEQATTPLIGMAGVWLALLRYWRSDTENSERGQQRLEIFRGQLATRGYHRLEQDIADLLHQQYRQPAPPLPHPMSTLYRRRASWEYALDALSQLTAAENTNTSRMAWFLTLHRYQLTLEPREQKYNRDGWTKGRPLSLKRLNDAADTLPWLLAQDRQALRHIHYTSAYSFYGHSGTYTLDAEAALPALVGHPAVFWQDAPDIRIDIEPGQVTLVITEAGEHLALTLRPPGISDSRGLLWEKETPTRLVVYPVSDEHRKIAGILGRELRIPASARDRVLQSVSSIAPLLPVQANLPELTAHIPHVPPDETLYAHLLPLGEGLRLQLRVHPLPGGTAFPPGRGGDIVNGEHDGQAIQTRRDLPAEQQRLQQVLAACPILEAAATDTTEWQLTETQDALEVLTQLRAIDPAQLECVWPEGERLRLGGRRDMQDIKLHVRRQGEWFALSGELALDDGKVLQLRQVLTLLQESRGRFIRLGEQDWLALDNQLRQRLQQIALLAGDGDHLTLNALTLPFLKTLADEAGHLDGDADWRRQLRGLEDREKHPPVVPSTLKAELRDYQQAGFCWLSRLAQWGVGACLADDMGLGKTLQALALLLERAPGGPQLVVVPTSIAGNWLSESERFAPTLRVRDYRRRREITDVGAFDVVVVSYGLLLQDAQTFADRQWHSVVLDEAQAIKNAQTQRARAVMALKADFRLALSGTPIENHLGELWSLFRFLNPGLLGGLKPFNQRFATPIEQGDRLAGSTLKQLLKPFILRRTKSQVLDELPPRTDILYTIPLSDEERHWYEALRQQAVERLDSGGDDIKPLQVLTEITRLRRFCCHPSLVLDNLPLAGSKLAACLDIIDELRENHHKALVFSQFVDHLTLLRTALDERGITCQYLDGSTSPTEREKLVAAFQSGEGDLFLISLKAGGTGLNLTAADYVIHLDPWWNPAVEDQASDRAHRIGQERPVTVYRLVMEDTIEEQMVALHSRKRQLAEDLLAGSDGVGRLDTQALLAVLRGNPT